jgi:hypothetical protein
MDNDSFEPVDIYTFSYGEGNTSHHLVVDFPGNDVRATSNKVMHLIL